MMGPLLMEVRTLGGGESGAAESHLAWPTLTSHLQQERRRLTHKGKQNREREPERELDDDPAVLDKPESNFLVVGAKTFPDYVGAKQISVP